MEGLGFDNILDEQEIENLFTEPEDTSSVETERETEETTSDPQEEEGGESKKDSTTEAVDPETLFEGEEPESVGSGNKSEEGKEDASTGEGGDTSPKNFYSSIAQACAVDGIFPNLDEETINKAVDAESFSDLIEAEVNARLDDKQQRISKALENGVEPTDIKRYENTLQYISSINDAMIAEESEKGEQLRRNLIYQDFLNKGYTPEKAQKYTERSIDNGNDVEDAKDALLSNKEFFQKEYNALLKEAQDNAEKEKADRQKQADKLKNSLLNDKQLFGDMEISSDWRKKTFENISRPVYKDPETGEYLTALQKYEMENRGDFLKYVGLFYTLTNGFKDFESFTKNKVKKEVRKGIRDLEQALSNSRSSATGGGMRMVAGGTPDPDSFFKGMELDL